MKPKRISLIVSLFVLWGGVFAFAGQREIPITIERVSERVIVLKETLMNNNIIVMASERGLIVVDSAGAPSIALRVREEAEKELGRSDFAYLINTHYHWDHSFGNQVFPEAKIIGHTGNTAGMIRNRELIRNRLVNFRERVAAEEKALRNLDSSSQEAEEKRRTIADLKAEITEYENDIELIPPEITFDDRMTLYCGDLTLKMYFFGRAHSGSDIFIHIPEEALLLTGDIFLDERWLPLFAGQPQLDIPRWIEVLSLLLDGEDPLNQAIPGHMSIWPREKLELWREYIVNLWEGVQAAKQEGLNIDQVLERFPLQNKYLYLKDLGHDDTRLRQFQVNNVRAFWRQLFKPAVEEVVRILEEDGIEKAAAKLRQIRSDPDYYFDEIQFNALGYRLMGEGKLKAAMAVFQMNVEAFPQSWNAYDSLAEVYMKNGDSELAIRFYEKSLELNPQNQNGKDMLKRLKKK